MWKEWLLVRETHQLLFHLSALEEGADEVGSEIRGKTLIEFQVTSSAGMVAARPVPSSLRQAAFEVEC